MSVPKKRRTRSSVKNRQSHDALKKIKLATCPKCKEKILTHTVSGNCGTYKGKQVLVQKIKKSASAKTPTDKENKEDNK